VNPVLPCPWCGKDTDFHEDEVEEVADGRAICLKCGLEMAETTMILEIVAGEHPHLVPDEEDEGDGASATE